MIFVSYSRRDILFAHALIREMSYTGVKYWLDTDNIRSMNCLCTQIQNGMVKCKSVIVILSPNSIESPWVNYEVHLAYNLDKPVCFIKPYFFCNHLASNELFLSSSNAHLF